MKVMIVDTTTNGRVEVAVADRDVIIMANVFEQSNAVTSFFVSGMNVKNQQAMYGTSGYMKWTSSISQ